MKKQKLEIISVIVVILILSLSEFFNVRSCGYKEINELKSKIEKFDKISEIFVFSNKTSTDFKLIQNLNILRNTIFWNLDKSFGYSPGDIYYPVIVNSDGKNIETQKNVIRPVSFNGSMLLGCSKSQIILAFSIQPSRRYLLIPVFLSEQVTVDQTNLQSKRILDKYEFSIKFGFHHIKLFFMLQLIFWGAVVFMGVRLIKRRSELREHEFLQKIKFNERRFFKSRDSLEKSHYYLLEQAICYVNRYQFLSNALKDINVPEKLPKDKKQLTIIGIFSGRINCLENIIKKILSIYEEPLKNYHLEVLQVHKSRGKVFCDEDLLSSLMIIVLSSVLKSSPIPQVIKSLAN